MPAISRTGIAGEISSGVASGTGQVEQDDSWAARIVPNGGVSDHSDSSSYTRLTGTRRDRSEQPAT